MIFLSFAFFWPSLTQATEDSPDKTYPFENCGTPLIRYHVIPKLIYFKQVLGSDGGPIVNPDCNQLLEHIKKNVTTVDYLHGPNNLVLQSDYRFEIKQLAVTPADFTLMPKLENLTLVGASVSSLTGNFFDGAPGLTSIVLTETGLTEIEPGVFESLKNLKELRISSNPIANLSAESFRGLEKLDSLTLMDVNFPVLTENFFRHMRSLTSVKLYNCKLSDIRADAFKGMTKLVKLDLSSNPIIKVTPDTFMGMPALEELTLASTNISELPINFFKNIPLVSRFNLSTNKGCPVGNVKASQCGGVLIETGAFSQAKKIQNIDFKYSNLRVKAETALDDKEKINVGAFKKIPTNVLKDLTGNLFIEMDDASILEWKKPASNSKNSERSYMFDLRCGLIIQFEGLNSFYAGKRKSDEQVIKTSQCAQEDQ